MKKMYNEEIKRQFLNEQYENERSRLTAEYIFYYSYLNELPLDKDLYDFSLDEIGKVIANSNPKSLNVATTRGSLISKYISWAIKINYRKSSLNPLQEISESWFEQYVDPNLKQFISKTELDYIVDNLVNYQDKIIPVLLFNGIYGTECSEIRNLRYSDVKEMKDGQIRVYDDENGERWISIGDDVVELLTTAYYENEYKNKNGQSTGRYESSPLIDSEFILRPLKRGKSTESQRMSQMGIINRIKMIGNYFDLPDLTPKSITRSGMLYKASELIGDKEELSQEDFEIIGEKFSLSKMKSNGYEYYNTSYLRGYINKDNIDKLYGSK